MTTRSELDVALRAVYLDRRLATPTLAAGNPPAIREVLQSLAGKVRERGGGVEVSIDDTGFVPRSATLQIVFPAGTQDVGLRQQRYSLLFSVSYLVNYFVRFWNAYEQSEPQSARVVEAPVGAYAAFAEDIARALQAAGYRELTSDECQEVVDWLDPSDTPVDTPVSVFDAAFSND